MKQKWIRIVLAVALLVCLAPMPYGYYVLVRYGLTIVLTFMAYEYGKNKQKFFCVICAALAGLFQPIMKVPLGRDIWNVVDIIVAIFLIYLCLHNKGLKKMITSFFWINNIDFINEKGHS